MRKKASKKSMLFGFAGAILSALVLLISAIEPPGNATVPGTAPEAVLATSQGKVALIHPFKHSREGNNSFLRKEEAQGGDCNILVPEDPLSAKGLATPWVLSNGPNTTGCTMANSANLGAFIQATILAPDGRLAAYDPLVITQGTQPAAPPPVPDIPAGSVVTISTGFNGNILFLTGPGADFFNQGFDGSPFGQVAFANGPAFFQAARELRVNVPALGTAKDGLACPTVRDFRLVDQDQSDNVTSQYIVTATGQTAEPGPGITGVLVGNGSDNRLIDKFLDPALGCTPFTVPSLSDPGTMEPTQATNELLAAADQQAPIALVPVNDPMTTVNADVDIIPNDFPQQRNLSKFKTDLYRSGVGQPPVEGSKVKDAVQYCQNLMAAGAQVKTDAQFETGQPGPMGSDLAQFMAARYAASLMLLNCAEFH